VAGRKKGGGSGEPEGSRLTREQKVEITRLYFEGASQGSLATRYGVSAPTIHRAVQEARKNGWVTISVFNNLALPPAVVDEETTLRIHGRLDGVSHIFVLKSDHPPTRDGTRYAIWSDRIHQRLGHYLGSRHVRAGIRDKDVIGVSSGRGVHYTIVGVQQEGIPLQMKDVALVSLTASFGMRSQSTSDPVVMDGDNNVGHFASAFGREVRLRTTGRGLAFGSGRQESPPWGPAAPNKAIVGIGVFERSNRLLSGPPSLAPVQAQLDQLSALVQDSTRGNYVPCADTCNALFWVPAPKGVVVSNELQIRKLIDEINKKLCAFPFEQLKTTADGVWIAAAGARKAHALLGAVRNGLLVNGLCIDASLADELLRLE
jgi:DNA-binding transcriptional regulator LsrR (DeoR family)